MEQKTIEVIPSPALYTHYRHHDTTVVMIDAIRASATICTALHYGAAHIIPLSELDVARTYKQHGYIITAERNTEKVPGFDKGNSPFEFMDSQLKNQPVAMTTTNGTKAIIAASGYRELLIGGFINFQALSDYLLQQHNNITLLCSGWKLRVNIEDNLFAGKIADFLMHHGDYRPGSEGATMAHTLYLQSKEDLYGSVLRHSPRLAAKEHLLGKDIDYCLQEQHIKAIPRYAEGRIVDAAAG